MTDMAAIWLLGRQSENEICEIYGDRFKVVGPWVLISLTVPLILCCRVSHFTGKAGCRFTPNSTLLFERMCRVQPLLSISSRNSVM